MIISIKNIFYRIKLVAKSEDFRERYGVSDTGFFRNQKIKLSTVIFFVLSCVKTGSSFDIKYFIKNSNISEFSAAAMTKARNKLSYGAFEEILSVMQEEPEPLNTWKGYRLFAIDGIVGELPRTPELMEKIPAIKDFFLSSVSCCGHVRCSESFFYQCSF